MQKQRTAADTLIAAAGGHAPADSLPSTPAPSYMQEINPGPQHQLDQFALVVAPTLPPFITSTLAGP